MSPAPCRNPRMCQQCNDFGATIRIRYPHELEHIIKHLRSAIAEGRLAIVSGDPDWDDFVKCELQCVTVAPCLFCTAKPATAREANGREKIQPDWLGPSVCARVRVAAGRYPTGGRSPATPRLPIARYGFRRPDLVHRAGGPGTLASGFQQKPVRTDPVRRGDRWPGSSPGTAPGPAAAG